LIERHDLTRGTATWLRSALVSTIVVASGAPPVVAGVLVSVDKNTQRMSVSVDGAPRYDFVVSTGRPGYGTPSGIYHPQRMERTWFSKEYYNSPMPHSIFFHGGFAIHGSYEINRLGGPASHGCIRLHPSDATILYTLVRTEGMTATTIVVSGTDTAAVRDQPYFNYGTAYSNYGTPYSSSYRWPEKPNAYRPFYPY
jgi:lipoprotein-anchoring transpeptidase ErfK/SrfK